MGPVCCSNGDIRVPAPVALKPEEQEIANQLQQKLRDSLNGLSQILQQTNNELIQITQPQQLKYRQ